jgi:hypothetical protein
VEAASRMTNFSEPGRSRTQTLHAIRLCSTSRLAALIGRHPLQSADPAIFAGTVARPSQPCCRNSGRRDSFSGLRIDNLRQCNCIKETELFLLKAIVREESQRDGFARAQLHVLE